MLSKAWKAIKIILLTLSIYWGSGLIGLLPLIPFGDEFITLHCEYLSAPILLLFIYSNTKNLKKSCKFNKIGIKLGLKSILITGFIAVFSGCLISFLTDVLHIKSSGLDSNVNDYKFLMSSTLGLISICLLGPIMEEILCRGFLLTKLRKVLNIKTAIIIQAIFFGWLHGNLIQFLDTFIMGLVAGCICYYTNSIFPSIIIHITNNTLVSFIALNPSWFDKHTLIVFTLTLVLFFIGIYTLWIVIDEYKSKANVIKKVA